MNEIKKTQKFVILDGHAILHRAYHALPPLTNKKGEVVNAVYGFLLVLFKVLREFQPDFVLSTFDTKAPTFRHKEYKEYKATRPPMEENLSSQIPKIKKTLEDFGVAIAEKDGYEADDIIGTASETALKKEGLETIIVSGDLDLLQLVDEKTKVYLLRKGVKDIVLYDKEAVKDRLLGLGPSQVVAFKSLRGDSSDNVPGVKGIGDKTATSLLLEFGDLENIYKNIDSKNISQKIKDLLVKFKDQVFLSEKIIRINKNVPMEMLLEDFKWAGAKEDSAQKALAEFGFQSLIKRLPELQKKDVGINLSLW